MYITNPGMTLPLLVRIDGSDAWITSPYRPSDGDMRETAHHRAARWALRASGGRDPGRLYSRSIGDGAVRVWTRRRLSVRAVTVRIGAQPRPARP